MTKVRLKTINFPPNFKKKKVTLSDVQCSHFMEIFLHVLLEYNLLYFFSKLFLKRKSPWMKCNAVFSWRIILCFFCIFLWNMICVFFCIFSQNFFWRETHLGWSVMQSFHGELFCFPVQKRQHWRHKPKCSPSRSAGGFHNKEVNFILNVWIFIFIFNSRSSQKRVETVKRHAVSFFFSLYFQCIFNKYI